MLVTFSGLTAPVQHGVPIVLTPNGTLGAAGAPSVLNDILKTLPPALASFVANLPAVEGNLSHF